MIKLQARGVLSFFVFLLAMAPAVFAADAVGPMRVGSAAVQWSTGVQYDRLVLTVSGPDGQVTTREFASGSLPNLHIQDLAVREGEKAPAEGTYSYELRVVPKISSDVQQRLAAARAADDE